MHSYVHHGYQADNNEVDIQFLGRNNQTLICPLVDFIFFLQYTEQCWH